MTLHYIQALELRTGVKRRQVETPCPFAQLIKVQQFLNLGIVLHLQPYTLHKLTSCKNKLNVIRNKIDHEE